MDETASRLTLRPTIIADERCNDDYEVMWNGLPIGRIYMTNHMPQGTPPWNVTGNLWGQTNSLAVLGKNLEDGKRLFREWWREIEPTLTADDIATARRIKAEIDERQRRWAEKQRRGS